MSKLDFGLWDTLSYKELQTAPTHEIYERHLRVAQEIEQGGFHSYFTIEHQSADVGTITGPTVWLSAVARATSVLRVGAMLWQLPFHHPVRLAQEVAMLDQLSHGRVEFGTGIGVHEHEFIRWGMDYYERGDRSMESMEIIRQCWTQNEVTYQGKFWQLDEVLPVPKPYQQPYPRTWVGAHGAAALEYAARGNFHVAQNNDIDSIIAQKFQYYWKIWAECNHPGPRPRVFLMRQVHVAETDAKAREEAEQYLVSGESAVGGGRVAGTRIGWGTNARGMGTISERPDNKLRGEHYKQAAQSYDFTIENGLAIVGSPETVIRKIAEGQEAMGYDLLCVNHQISGMPWDLAHSSLQLFLRHVVPAFERVEDRVGVMA